MARPKGSKNKTADQIAAETKTKLKRQLKKVNAEDAKEIEEAIAELADVADLLAPETPQEVLPEPKPIETPKHSPKTPVTKDPSRTPRFIGRHPITKEPVYK